MNRAELVEAVRRELGPSVRRAEAERAVRAVLEALGTGLRQDRGVQLVGFGNFKVTERAPRRGTDPRTGVSIALAGSRAVRFTAGKDLKNRL